MRKIKTFITVLAANALVAGSALASVYAPIDSSYKLTFDDEFNGSSVNTSVWTRGWFPASSGAATGPVNSFELQSYDPAQVVVSGGNVNLRLEHTPQTVGGVTYSNRSGMINTIDTFSQAYGYFEARINLSATSGVIANWPAFWLLGHEAWPTSGEIDIMEGLEGNAASTYHIGTCEDCDTPRNP